MKIYTTGYKGKIGQRLVGLGALPLDLKLTESNSVAIAAKSARDADVIIHCAAMSSIRECEKDYDKALAVNVRGTAMLCEEFEAYGLSRRIVLISSEQVFDGFWGNYKENAKQNPVNNYGHSKLGAEVVVRAYDGKILRLSRVVSIRDVDISQITAGTNEVPTFIKRSYSHIDFAVQSIWWYANNFKDMPNILHYGGDRRISYYEFAKMLNPLTQPRKHHENGNDPRPFNCGLNVSLARKLGMPIQRIEDTVTMLRNEK